MKLRERTLLAVTSTLIGCITILYLLSSEILHSNIEQAEQNETTQQVDNFSVLLHYTQEKLAQSFISWAVWDDTYQFVEDKNQTYIRSNLTLSMLETSHIDFMLFFNKQGNYVYGLGFGEKVLTETDIANKLTKQLIINGQLQAPWNTEANTSGIIVTPESPLWLASFPIYPTEQSNNSVFNGYFVVGRIINSEYWGEISRVLQNTLTTYPLISAKPLPIDFRHALEMMYKQQADYVKALSYEHIAGYTIIYDINKSPALIARILVPRKTYQAGQKYFKYVLISIISIGIILLLVILLVFEKIVLNRLGRLIREVADISQTGHLTKRVSVIGDDELTTLTIQINHLLSALEGSQAEVLSLNANLYSENTRMANELEVSHRIQRMVLPKNHELQQLADLEVALAMHAATEVGGDYCDVFQQNGHIICGIGDVTGHGLESGVIMLMVQSALRALFANDAQLSPQAIWNALNHMVCQNVRRMELDKNLSLLLVDYYNGKARLMGQHEEVLIIRQHKPIERIDTFELGFVIGLSEEDMSAFVKEYEITLEIDEGIVLFTDGITEAENEQGEFYGIERLCSLIESYKQASASLLQQAIMDDLTRFIGNATIYDDITLIVLKRCR
ncbi:serine phosphatase RsbU, regulator of sigma subunit [Beggiatoa alba B18LD]|uniref:Serine phosphatase RsbU, regulator of sigma subunit n=1 Tax=Beggiatoa alba B18LD TaxID=395493 RepID=I3CEW4_9GAMM|nr:SpoIIE family protein phosphatase [Beggiatoa alba]EIJ42157.1 serine phosphatase RsbU, regulator of sigma subunit [Beggiatoa alba B18LD]